MAVSRTVRNTCGMEGSDWKGGVARERRKVDRGGQEEKRKEREGRRKGRVGRDRTGGEGKGMRRQGGRGKRVGVGNCFITSCQLIQHNEITSSLLTVSSFPTISLSLVGRYFSTLKVKAV